MESKKLYYTMGEVCEMFDVPPSTIRHWERYFDQIKVVRNKKGNRLFDGKAMDAMRLVYHLVKERGMTLEGAKRSLRASKESVSRDAQMLETLMTIRSMLVEVREDLRGDEGNLLEPNLEIDLVDEPQNIGNQSDLIERESEIETSVDHHVEVTLQADDEECGGDEQSSLIEPVFEQKDEAEIREENEFEQQAQRAEYEQIEIDAQNDDDDPMLQIIEDERDVQVEIEESVEGAKGAEGAEEDVATEEATEEAAEPIDQRLEIEEDMQQERLFEDEPQAESVEKKRSVIVRYDENGEVIENNGDSDAKGSPQFDGKPRRLRRKKEDDGSKELFAYYEQKLF